MIRSLSLAAGVSLLALLTACGGSTNAPAVEFLIPVEVVDVETDAVEDIAVGLMHLVIGLL